VIASKQWVWPWSIRDEIVKITPQVTIETWKKDDPLCGKYAWYNILMNFAIARAMQLGLTKAIRKPKWKTCLLCMQKFVEDSLPVKLIERLGIERIDVCAPCLRDTVTALGGSGNNSAPAESISEYLKALAVAIGRVPTQNYGEGMTDLLDLDTDERLTVLKLLQKKPSAKRVKVVFGSWLNALIQAGVLEDGTRKTPRGTQTIAKDGHVCLSLGEKTIDDFLYTHGIRHEKEPRYPEGRFRGDFKVGTVFIEYFGLVGNPDYEAKIKEKNRICREHSITLVAIYPNDLISQRKLEDKLTPFIPVHIG